MSLSRNGDPIASHLAGESAKKFIKQHQALIVLCLRQHGQLTADEIASISGLNKYQVCRRLPELESAGTAKPTGQHRKTPSGRLSRVWGIIERK